MQQNQSNPLEQDPAIKQCFDTLPITIQESVKQSGVQITSVQQLQNIADQMMKKQ